MNKIRLITKKAYSNISLKGQKGQQLCEREIHSINSGSIPGLLGMEVRGKGGTFELIYNVTGLVPLKSYLEAPLKKSCFASLLGSVLETQRGMRELFFSEDGLLLNPELAMVNPFTQSLHFVYVPIQNYTCQTPLRNFLQSIVQLGSFALDEDSSYMREYILILNSGINFSVFELEEYWKRISGIKAADVAVFESEYKPQLEGSAIYDPLRAQTTPERECYTSDSMESEQTHGGFGAEGTVLMGTVSEQEPQCPYLIRERSNEKVVIHKLPFRIGQSPFTCDYVITDNPAISRNHAQLFAENGQYFIVDLGSMNKTYVDGNQVLPEQSRQLAERSKLQLANETLVFYTGNI